MTYQFKNQLDAISAFEADRAGLESYGAVLPLVKGYLTPEMKRDYRIALDAQPGASTDPNSAIPALLTTMIDPEVIAVAFAPNKAAEILGEEKRGTWVDDTLMLPTSEEAGEVSTYGDYNNNGTASVNFDYPSRQSYLFQTVKQIGDREIDRAGLMRLNLVTEKDRAAADLLNRFSNLTYFYGVSGLSCFGLFNSPGLNGSLTPATKAAGGVTWFTGGGSPNATPNEVYNDLLAVWEQLVLQTAGMVSMEDELVLGLSPSLQPAMQFANSYGVMTIDLLKKSFSKLRVVTAVQYGVQSAANPQGNASGNFMQLIAPNFNGKKTGFCAFNERLRGHSIVRDLSSYKQKLTGGTWGAIIRQPVAVASMLGM